MFFSSQSKSKYFNPQKNFFFNIWFFIFCLQAIAKAEYVLKELEAISSLHKYRTIKKRYYDEISEEPKEIALQSLQDQINKEK
jgi:hypothetical protein